MQLHDHAKRPGTIANDVRRRRIHRLIGWDRRVLSIMPPPRSTGQPFLKKKRCFPLRVPMSPSFLNYWIAPVGTRRHRRRSIISERKEERE